jgi:hypothetical protein
MIRVGGEGEVASDASPHDSDFADAPALDADAFPPIPHRTGSAGNVLRRALDSTHETPAKRKKALRKAIAEYVLVNHARLSCGPLVEDQVQDIATFEKSEKLLLKRIEKIREARQQYTDLEQGRLSKEKELNEAKASLHSLAGELGAAAFDGLRADQFSPIPLFDERLALQERIESIQQELNSLRDAAPSTLVERGKAKARQVVLLGSLKLEETKIGKTDQRLGKALLDDRKEDAVRCAATQDLLGRLSARRGDVLKSVQAVDAALSKLQRWVGKLDPKLGLTGVHAASDFDDTVENAQEEVAEIRRSLRGTKNRLTDIAMHAEGPMPAELERTIVELRQIDEDAKHKRAEERKADGERHKQYDGNAFNVSGLFGWAGRHLATMFLGIVAGGIALHWGAPQYLAWGIAAAVYGGTITAWRGY